MIQEFRFNGGPNNGLTIKLDPGTETRLKMGRHEYTIRHHDCLLMFRGYNDDDRPLPLPFDPYNAATYPIKAQDP